MTKKNTDHVTIAGKTYISLNYLDNLRSLSSQLKKNATTSDTLLVPFVLTCAAALEAMLNDEIISWAQESFPLESYKRIADTHLSISLRGKLDYIVPLRTCNSYIFRTNSAVYGTLSRLITRRNELMHAKSFFNFHKIDLAGGGDDPLLLNPLNLEKLKELPSGPSDPYHEVTTEECLSYYEAINEFETGFLWLLDEESAGESEFIMRNPKYKLPNEHI